MTEYFIFYTDSSDKKSCFLDIYPDHDYLHKPSLGQRMSEQYYPQVVDFHMSDDLWGIEVPDMIANTMSLYIVSENLRAVIDEHAYPEFEYLPVNIIDRKNIKVKKKYFIANLIGTQIDCADKEKSIMDPNIMMQKKGKDRYENLRKLYIDESKIDRKINIFRLLQMPELFIVNASFKKVIEKENFRGCQFFKMGEDVDIF